MPVLANTGLAPGTDEQCDNNQRAGMTPPLEDIFRELGIAQYLGAFLDQGFDTWETILDITESDLYVRARFGG